MEKILVLGLSKSGIAAAKLGLDLGFDVYLTESKSVVDELKVQELKVSMLSALYYSHFNPHFMLIYSFIFIF